MAKVRLARRRAPLQFRRKGPSPLVGKLRDSLSRANKRARNAGSSTMFRDVLTAAGAAALGKLEQTGTVPAKIGPLDSALVIGALGAFVVPRFVTGKAGSMAHDITLGALCVAAYRIGGGAPLMGDEDDLGAAGWG